MYLQQQCSDCWGKSKDPTVRKVFIWKLSKLLGATDNINGGSVLFKSTNEQ